MKEWYYVFIPKKDCFVELPESMHNGMEGEIYWFFEKEKAVKFAEDVAADLVRLGVKGKSIIIRVFKPVATVTVEVSIDVKTMESD
jgi:hypothetical protein